MLAANLILLRPVFAPLERLATRMKHVDLLRPGQRVPVDGSGEVTELVTVFNDMLDRLEIERRESGRRTLSAQEEQRRRIARGLHDEIGQRLTGVLLHLNQVSEEAPPSMRTQLDVVREEVRGSLDAVREVVQELRPSALDELGLVSALTSLAVTFSRQTGIRVERQLSRQIPALSPEAELTVYRVAQEGLTNVARHAQATSVRLVLESRPPAVILRVIDDGRGFPGGLPEGTGGLRGMRERAVLLGAALAINQPDAGGVEIRLEVPVGGEP
jgi:two-component system sensor histidine kinase UhpB